MSRGINWFKNIKIEEEIIDFGLGKEINYKIEYLNGNNTSFSEGNIIKYQGVLNRYGNIAIPYIEYEYCSKPTYLEFINPKILSDVCSKFLNNSEEKDKYDIRNTIEWFKEMSDNGYYFSYDSW